MLGFASFPEMECAMGRKDLSSDHPTVCTFWVTRMDARAALQGAVLQLYLATGCTLNLPEVMDDLQGITRFPDNALVGVHPVGATATIDAVVWGDNDEGWDADDAKAVMKIRVWLRNRVTRTEFLSCQAMMRSLATRWKVGVFNRDVEPTWGAVVRTRREA